MLGMRLGGGSGCPIAFRVMEAACAIINEMATFEQAAINDDYLEPIRAADSFTVTKADVDKPCKPKGSEGKIV